MVERELFEIIQEGLQYYKDKPIRLERFFRNDMELSAAEAAKIRLYFAGGTDADGNEIPARPPTLIHGYARTGGPFPCWALVLGAERVDTDYLGEDASFLDSDGLPCVDEDGNPIDPKVRRMKYTFNVLVHADHPDVCIWYYQLLKRIVIAAHDVLIQRDIDDLEFSGMDLQPDPRLLPSDVFTRLFQVVVSADETWAEQPQTERPGAKTLTGLHIDDDGSQVPDGAVSGEKALVTPYTE